MTLLIRLLVGERRFYQNSIVFPNVPGSAVLLENMTGVTADMGDLVVKMAAAVSPGARKDLGHPPLSTMTMVMRNIIPKMVIIMKRRTMVMIMKRQTLSMRSF